jgi:branched-chain amino acid transport system substrate-binding protein
LRSTPGRLSVLITIAATVAACGAGTTSVKAGEVVFGFIHGTTGTTAPNSIPAYEGAQMVVQQINAQGGFQVGDTSYKIKLVGVDDRSDQATDVAATQQLINDDKAIVILGPSSVATPATAQLTQPAHVIQFTASTSAAALAGTPGFEGLFIVLPDIPHRAKSMVGAIKKWLPQAKKVAIVGPNDATAAVLMPALESQLVQAGLTSTENLYPVGTVNLQPILTRVASGKPDVLIMGWFGPSDATNILRQMDASGIDKNVAILGYAQSTATLCPQVGGRTCLVLSIGYDVRPDVAAPKLKQIIADYFKFTGKSQLPDIATAIPYFYDPVFMVIDAMKRAGTVTDGAKIAKELHKVTRDGVAGPAAFSDTNFMTVALPVSLVQGGQTTVETFG